MANMSHGEYILSDLFSDESATANDAHEVHDNDSEQVPSEK